MPPQSGVTITLDRERTLRFTTRALMAVEERTGMTFGEVASQMQKGSLTAVVTMAWAALRWEDPALTVDDVADLMDMAELGAVSEAMAGALAEHLGANEGKAKARSKAKAKG